VAAGEVSCARPLRRYVLRDRLARPLVVFLEAEGVNVAAIDASGSIEDMGEQIWGQPQQELVR